MLNTGEMSKEDEVPSNALSLVPTGMWCLPLSIMKASPTGGRKHPGTGIQWILVPTVTWLVNWERLSEKGSCLILKGESG